MFVVAVAVIVNKVVTTALAAAATFGVSYATILRYCCCWLLLSCHCRWLIVTFLDYFLVSILPLLFFRWCCHCSFADDSLCHCFCRHHHPFSAHCTMVPPLLLIAVIAIAIATGWLLLLFVLLWLLLFFAVAVIAACLWWFHCLAVTTFSMHHCFADTTAIAACGYQHHCCWLPVDCCFFLAVAPPLPMLQPPLAFAILLS